MSYRLKPAGLSPADFERGRVEGEIEALSYALTHGELDISKRLNEMLEKADDLLEKQRKTYRDCSLR